jgi:hypothetical protein
VSKLEDLANLIKSRQGLKPTGEMVGELIKSASAMILSMDVGDFVRPSTETAITVPVASDLWYLMAHDNFMAHYYANAETTVEAHKDYTEYMNDCMDFLQNIPGLKPLKVLRELSQMNIETTNNPFKVFGLNTEYANNGVYWINRIAFENWNNGRNMQYASDGPKGYKPNDYVGYISFPVGQLGVMEVLSLIQETKIKGYVINGIIVTAELELKDNEKPIATNPPEIFPHGKDGMGTLHSGQNYCYGQHIIESGYWKVDGHVELLSSKMKEYGEEVEPKSWMRYWIHRNSTWPVPGEFIGILAKPVSVPPHVWWFQESSPFIYAGNWIETGNLTSGEIVTVTLEADRPSGSVGNEYEVLVQGCLVTIYASDFFLYAVGDRVAILKLDTTAAKLDKSYTWLNQPTLKEVDELTKKANYIIIPAVFYKPGT